MFIIVREGSVGAQPGQEQRQQVKEPDHLCMFKVHSELMFKSKDTARQSDEDNSIVSCLLWQKLIYYASEVSQRTASRSRPCCKGLQPNCDALLLSTALVLFHHCQHAVRRP